MDAPGQTCTDSGSPYPATRLAQLATRCRCMEEQHYFYVWDELMRISDAYRWDRTGGSTGTWTMAVRQRYLYDSANERTVKQTLDQDVMSSTPEAVALYVYPGDFERRGLVRNVAGTSYTALAGAETQYVIGGARVVWRTGTHGTGMDRDQRVTIGLSERPSTSATPRPDGFVPRAGGHATVSAELGGDPAAHAGFAAILEEGGTLRLTWRSGTLNAGPSAEVPLAARDAIVRAVEAATGRTVSTY